MTESDIQIQLVQYLELVKDKFGFMFFSSPNEGMGRAQTGAGLGRMARLKKMGLRHGVADLIFVKDGRVYFLELKKQGGRQSAYQKEVEQECHKNGAHYVIAFSFEDAIFALDCWGIIRK